MDVEQQLAMLTRCVLGLTSLINDKVLPLLAVNAGQVDNAQVCSSMLFIKKK